MAVEPMDLQARPPAPARPVPQTDGSHPARFSATFRSAKRAISFLVELDYTVIVAANDEQRGRSSPRQVDESRDPAGPHGRPRREIAVILGRRQTSAAAAPVLAPKYPSG